MTANGVVRWLIISLAAIIAASVSTAAYADYGTFTGVHPEAQSKRTASSQTKALSDFNGICSEASGRCAEIAAILQEGLTEQFDEPIPLQGLDQVTNSLNQIILGIISNPTIASLANQHKQNVIDLGEEGYTLISLPNPFSTTGAWRILIVGADTKGVFRGAQALIDLIEGVPSSAIIGDYRVRDYPDRQYRGLMHWMPQLSGTMEDYVSARRDEFKELAQGGCNVLLLGRNDWWHMNNMLDDVPISLWMTTIAATARYYGIEPVPEIYPFPYMVGYENPGLREGEYVSEEPFLVVSNGQGGYKLTPQIAPFDNAASNLGFETHSGYWPDDWTISPSGDFTYTSDAKGHYLQHNSSDPFYLLRSWNDMSLFQPRSFYVLEVTYANTPSCVNLRVYARNSDNKYFSFPGESPFGGTGVKDYYFWTPPLNAASAPDEYNAHRQALPLDQQFANYPYFEEFASLHLQIDCSGAGTCSSGLRLDGFFLERRESALRNVMMASSDSYLGISDDGLPVTVKNARTQTICVPGADYTFDHVPPLNFLMRTHEYPGGVETEAKSSFAWLNTAMLTDTMLVSYSLGVPYDWFPDGQRTRYCMSSAALYRRLGQTMEDLYTVFPGSDSAINPKYIDIRNDEMRGINRCGRCEAEGLTNAMHLIDYVKNIQLILDDIATRHPAAAATSLICSWDMLNPWHNGGQEDYQYKYGGPWGATAGELDELAGTNVKLIIQLGWVAADSARNHIPVWPGSEAGSADVHVAACLMPEGSPGEYDVPEYFAKQSTWYASDCLGFSSVASYNTQHSEAEYRWLDYGWKRYKHPDATMHAYENDFFATDDTGGHLIEIPKGRSLVFAPFGNPEYRDPELGSWTTDKATITWGGGTPEDVLSKLNSNLVAHTFNSAGSFNVTLKVRSVCGGDQDSMTAIIPVTVRSKDEDPIPIDPTAQSQNNAVTFGVKSIAPNPFNPVTAIQFGLSRASEVRLAVYDVGGHQVRKLLDGERTLAGLHTMIWNGRNEHGVQVASGIYFVRLMAERQVQTRKIVLMR